MRRPRRAGPSEKLGCGPLADLVRLPAAEDISDWHEPIGLLCIGPGDYDVMRASIDDWLPFLSPDASIVFHGASGGATQAGSSRSWRQEASSGGRRRSSTRSCCGGLAQTSGINPPTQSASRPLRSFANMPAHTVGIRNSF